MDTYRSYVVYSPLDGGYYVEIINRRGVTVETWPKGSHVYKQRATAKRKGWERVRTLVG